MKRLFISYLLILSCLHFISCGKQEHELNADGQIDIVIDWNLNEFAEAFKDSCEAKFDNQIDIDQCVVDAVANLVNLIREGIEQAEKQEE